MLSKQSIEEKGEIHRQIRNAIDVFKEYPENSIYFIPVRLDDCQIPFESLKNYQWADLFPQSEWFNSINKILQSMRVSKKLVKTDALSQKEYVIYNEKNVFVDRKDYIDNKIKTALRDHNVVSIIGPGGSGKTQLAYKAMQTYINEERCLMQ